MIDWLNLSTLTARQRYLPHLPPNVSHRYSTLTIVTITCSWALPRLLTFLLPLFALEFLGIHVFHLLDCFDGQLINVYGFNVIDLQRWMWLEIVSVSVSLFVSVSLSGFVSVSSVHLGLGSVTVLVRFRLRLL